MENIYPCSEDMTRGRYVVTSDDLSEGEVIFSEEPYSSVLLPDQYSTHCNHCYRQGICLYILKGD